MALNHEDRPFIRNDLTAVLWTQRTCDKIKSRRCPYENSICGAAEAWLKSDGKPMTFDSYEEAAAKAESLMKNIGTVNVSYYPKEIEIELNEAQSFGMNMKL